MAWKGWKMMSAWQCPEYAELENSAGTVRGLKQRNCSWMNDEHSQDWLCLGMVMRVAPQSPIISSCAGNTGSAALEGSPRSCLLRSVHGLLSELQGMPVSGSGRACGCAGQFQDLAVPLLVHSFPPGGVPAHGQTQMGPSSSYASTEVTPLVGTLGPGSAGSFAWELCLGWYL